MNKKLILVIIIVFILVSTISYSLINLLNSDKYFCFDYDTDTYYSFKTEEEMHEVCDKFNGVEDDKKMSNYTIYDDLINANDRSFSFDPYINSNNELSIIVKIIDCNNQESAKEKAKKWFSNHSYNINDYVIEYEYPCN